MGDSMGVVNELESRFETWIRPLHPWGIRLRESKVVMTYRSSSRGYESFENKFPKHAAAQRGARGGGALFCTGNFYSAGVGCFVFLSPRSLGNTIEALGSVADGVGVDRCRLFVCDIGGNWSARDSAADGSRAQDAGVPAQHPSEAPIDPRFEQGNIGTNHSHRA